MLSTHKKGKSGFQRLSALSRFFSALLLIGTVMPSPAVFASEEPAAIVQEASAPLAPVATTSAQPQLVPAEVEAPVAERVPVAPVEAETSEAPVTDASTEEVVASESTSSAAVAESEASDSPAGNDPWTGNLVDEGEADTSDAYTAERDREVATLPESTVEVSVTEQAKQEYVADETLEAGDEVVVTEAKDGTVTTTTTYKVVTSPNVDLGAEAESVLNSDRYRYTDETIYSVDQNQSLPSDRIVIDKLFVSVPSTQNLNQVTGVRDLVQSDYTVVRPTAGTLSGYTLTTEMLDPSNPDIRTVKYYSGSNVYGAYNLVDFSRDEDLYNELFEKSYAYLIELSSGGHVERLMPLPQDNTITQADAVRRYFAKNRMNDSLYADAKANYQRFKLAASHLQSLKNLDERQQSMLGWADIAFEGITQRYNYLNGSDQLNIHYEGNIPDSVKREFEQQIKKIPFEYRQNLVYLRVTDQRLPGAAKTDSPVGLAYYATGNIDLQYYTGVGGYTVGQPGAMLVNLVHEIGHIVDANGGIFGVYEYAYPSTHRDSRSNVLGFRYTKEFQEVFNNFIKDKENYMDYYTKNIEEAFAEFLGRYVAKRAFNWTYPRYKTINGNVYWTSDNDPEGFTPMDQAEPYFAKLYSDLFERPNGRQVVVDAVNRVYSPVQNGLIKIGTKPEEELIDIPFKTEMRDDPTLEAGKTEILQAGVNGQMMRLTTFFLTNKETGDLANEVTETVLKDVVNQIVRVGTKPAESSSEEPASSSEAVSSESAAESSSEEAVSSESSEESVDPTSESSSEEVSSESSADPIASESVESSSETSSEESSVASEVTSESSSEEVSSESSADPIASESAESSSEMSSEESNVSSDIASESSSEDVSSESSAASSMNESSESMPASSSEVVSSESSESSSESTSEVVSSESSESSSASESSESVSESSSDVVSSESSSESSAAVSESKGDQFNSGAAYVESELPEGSVPAEASSSSEAVADAQNDPVAPSSTDNATLPNTGSQAEAGFFAIGLLVMLGGVGLVASKRKEAA